MEERVKQLEEKVAELERRIQEQPSIEDILKKLNSTLSNAVCDLI